MLLKKPLFKFKLNISGKKIKQNLKILFDFLNISKLNKKWVIKDITSTLEIGKTREINLEINKTDSINKLIQINQKISETHLCNLKLNRYWYIFITNNCFAEIERWIILEFE